MGLFSKLKAKKPKKTKLICTPNNISSYKCVFLANYRKLPIDIQWEETTAFDEKISESLKLSSLKRYPCIVDGEFTVCGENAVLSYLNIKGQAPSIHPRKARVLAMQQYWIQVLTTIFMPLVEKRSKNQKEINEVLNLLNTALEEKKYIVGEFSLADIHWVAAFKSFEEEGIDYSSQFINIRKWLENIKHTLLNYNTDVGRAAA